MIERLLRPSIRDLRAYESARSLASSGTAFLDANESSSAPSFAEGMNRYPAPQPKELIDAFARALGIGSESVLVGRGSDEMIDLLVRCLCEPGRDLIAISSPTYGMYRVAAGVQGCGLEDVPLLRPKGEGLSFALDVDGLARASRLSGGRVKIIFVCSPNNPTGEAWPASEITRLCRAASETSMVVVDEAYAEFSEDGGFLRGSGLGARAFEEHKNLAVLRTLSKAHALAGARVGALLSNPASVQVLRKALAPYPLPLPSVELASQALSNEGLAETQERIRGVRARRDALAARLADCREVLEVGASEANFILARFRDSARVLSAARSRGIVLRDRSGEPGLRGCVRISIGTDEECQAVAELIEDCGRGDFRGAAGGEA